MQRMNYLVQFKKLNYKNLKTIFVNVRILSTQAQPQDIVVEPKTDQSLWTRVLRKKPQKPPFMKNIFLGEFDVDMLAFPEVLNKDELSRLNDNVSYLKNNIAEFEKVSDKSTKLLSEAKAHFQSINIFGLQSAKLLKGLELNHTESCRLLEIISRCSSLATSLVAHQYFGVNAITYKSSEHLRQTYLSKLSNGENIAAFCVLEEGNPDPRFMKTKAELSDDGKTWILNGTKSWVVNGSQSDVYFVLASTDHGNSVADQDKITVLVVEKVFGGVTSIPCQPAGFKGADICDVHFENTPVPVENVLGIGSGSIKIITSLLSELRLSTGPICITLMHKLIKNFSDYCLHTKYGQKYLSETDFARGKMAHIDINLYATESLTYMTAGLMDDYENQDCELESAIIKVFSSEKCLDAVQQYVKLLGPAAYMEDHWLYRLYNDAIGNVLLNETNDSLRMVISLLGLQHAGLQLNNEVKKLRNPFFNPGHIIKKMWQHRRQDSDNPKLELGLEEYLHPSLTHGARWLEYCVYRLQYATESMLIRYGPEVIEQHMVLKRLADVAMDIYAMVSVLSRSSRSYCIGLRNADYELLLANAFCLDARDRVKNNVLEIVRGPYGTNDVNYRKIANQAFKFNGYFAEHTLTKNF